MIEELEKTVDLFLSDSDELGAKDIPSMQKLLEQLAKEGSDRALSLTLRLAGDDYGGMTHKAEFQTFACVAALFWERKGIEGLRDMVISNSNYRNLSNVTYLLSHVASGRLESYHYYQRKKLVYEGWEILQKVQEETLILKARESLVEIARVVEKNDLFPTGLVSILQFYQDTKVQETVFATLLTRWFHFNRSGLNNFNELINEDHPEQTFHEFIENNKMLLDPFAAQIWSKPKFGSKLIPDFLIRSIDNSYTVVEIEKPNMKIMTKNGNLSAEATHAKRQAIDYREWATSNQLYASKEFPEIWRPFALVVIGLERELTPLQKEQLRKENESTHGAVRIVGFDWLFDRAMASFDNLIKFGFERSPGD